MQRTDKPRPRPSNSAKAGQAPFVEDQQLIHSSHGVGRVSSWQQLEIDGRTARVLVVDFPAARMTMRVPEAKVGASGLRMLASRAEMRAALATLAEKPVRSSAPWKTSSAGYLEKLNSGQPRILAELVRDLRPGGGAGAARIHDDALARLADELALVNGIPVDEAKALIESHAAAAPAEAPADAAG